MKWPWRKDNEKKARAVEAEAQFEAVRRERADVARKARELADLPPDEVAIRMARALRHRPT